MLIAWLPAFPGRRARFLIGAVLFVLLAGLAITQSRAAFAALLVGVVAAAFTRNRRLGFLIALIGILLAATLYTFLVDLRLTETAGAVTDLGMLRHAESDAYRLETVLRGPALFATSPIFGVGLGEYWNITGDASHNWFMLVLAEQGMVGITLMGLAIIAVLRGLMRRALDPRAVGMGVLVVFLTGGMFLEPMSATQWAIPAMIILAAAFVAHWDPTTSPRPPTVQRAWTRIP